VEVSTFQSLQRQSGKTTSQTYNTIPDPKLFQATLKDYIKARKSGKIGSFHTFGWKEVVHSKYGQVYTRDITQAGNVFIRTRTLVSKGYDGGLPSSVQTMKEVLAKLGGTGVSYAPEPVQAVPAQKAPEAVHRPELEASPTVNGIVGSTALIPATDQLPAKLVLKNGKPNSVVTFHLRHDGALLKARGKQNRYELPVKTDRNGRAEVFFHYTGRKLSHSVEYEVIAMNEGKKATAKIAVGLGLEFDRIRAIQGQSFVANIYAFSLGVKSSFHPSLNVPNYLYFAEQAKVWGDRKLGIRIAPEWLNRENRGDSAYDWTTEIKNLPAGYSLVATESAKRFRQPYYEGNKYSYPAVRLGSTGKHIYRVPGSVVVMNPDGVVLKKETAEPDMKNNPLLVMTVDPNPDSYFKMLSCSLDAQDGIQWLIWEGAKKIPGGAGKVFEGVQTGAGILCKLADGDYENAFYDFGNYAGGKSLDRLGNVLKEHPDKYSKKVHAAYENAKFAHEKLMEKKDKDERDRLIRKSLEKYGMAQPRSGGAGDIDPKQAPVTTPSTTQSQGGKPGDAVSGRSAEDSDLKKAGKDIGKSFEDLGESLKNLFK
jgi:hypothetical protein